MKKFNKNKPFLRILSLFICVSFLSSTISPGLALAQDLTLPNPTQLVPLSDSYSFPLLKGMKFDPSNPLNMEFIIDTADKRKVSEDEASVLIKYFLAGLTIPEEELWVNMSPYEADKMITPALSQTDLGKDLLSQDYILKQLSSSLTYPETEIGKDFWLRTYQEVLKVANTTNIPINTFNKLWIVPDKALIHQNGNFAFIKSAGLKAMLEEDYLALKNNIGDIKKQKKGLKEELIQKVNAASSSVVRNTILPKINTEINQGKNFATLRQIYYSLILGVWFKQRFKDSIYSYYINQAKVKGIDIADKDAKDKIYNLYVEAFKKGVYNYTKTEKDLGTGRRLKRQYFSGGTAFAGFSRNDVTKIVTVAGSPFEPGDIGGTLNNVGIEIQDVGLMAASPILIDKSNLGTVVNFQTEEGVNVFFNGWNATSLKWTLSEKLKPDVIVFPPLMVRKSKEYGSPEFLQYYNLFFIPEQPTFPINMGFRKGRYTFLVAQNEEQRQAIKNILTQSFLSSQREFYENAHTRLRRISEEDILPEVFEQYGQERTAFPTVGKDLSIDQFAKVVILGEEFDYTTGEGVRLRLKIERDALSGAYQITETKDNQPKVYQNIIPDEYKLPVMKRISPTPQQIEKHSYLNRPDFGYTVLGDSQGTDAYSFNTSFLVSVEGKYLWIDGSPEAYQAIKDLKIPSADIEYIFLTHIHDDHDAILGRILNGTPVKLIAAPAVYIDFMEKLRNKLELYKLKIDPEALVEYIKILPGEKISIFGGKAVVQIPDFYNRHTLFTTGLKITYAGGGQAGPLRPSIAYSADTKFDPRLIEFLKDAGVVFHDAGVFPLHPTPVTLDEKITDENLRKKMYLVHATDAAVKDAASKSTNSVKLQKAPLLEAVSIVPADIRKRLGDKKRINDLLAMVAYLSNLPEETINRLSDKAGLRRFKDGELIINKGSIIEDYPGYADVLYVVYAGDVVVEFNGQKIVLEPGMTFGEFSAMDPTRPRSADVKAGQDNATVIALNKETVDSLVKEFPDIKDGVKRIQQNLIYLEKLAERDNSPFNQLPLAVLYDLAAKIKETEFKERTEIFHQGNDIGKEGAYIITQGQVSITVNGQKVKTITDASSENVIGEGAFFDAKNKRNATVTAETEVKTLQITTEDFQIILKKRPGLWHNLYTLAALRANANAAAVNVLGLTASQTPEGSADSPLKNQAASGSPITILADEVKEGITPDTAKALFDRGVRQAAIDLNDIPEAIRQAKVFLEVGITPVVIRTETTVGFPRTGLTPRPVKVIYPLKTIKKFKESAGGEISSKVIFRDSTLVMITPISEVTKAGLTAGSPTTAANPKEGLASSATLGGEGASAPYGGIDLERITVDTTGAAAASPINVESLNGISFGGGLTFKITRLEEITDFDSAINELLEPTEKKQELAYGKVDCRKVDCRKCAC